MQRIVARLMIAGSLAASSATQAGQIAWESIFTVVPGPLTQGFNAPRIIGSNAAVFAAIQPEEPGHPLVARIDAQTGAVLWSASARTALQPGEPILALPDGSSITVAHALTRRDPAGNVVWSVAGMGTASALAARLQDGSFVIAARTANAPRVTRYDSATGAELETLALPAVDAISCPLGRLEASSDAVHVITGCASTALMRIALDPLRLEWALPATLSNGASIGVASLLAIDDEHIFVTATQTAQTQLARLSIADGCVVWAQPNLGSVSHLVTSADGDALVVRSISGMRSIDRFARVDGALVWSTSEAGVISAIDASATVLVTAGVDAAAPDMSTGFLAGFDLDSGALIWRRNAPPSNGGETRLSDVAISGDAIVAIGAERDVPWNGQWTVRSWRTALSPGTAVSAAPIEAPAGNDGLMRVDGDGHVLAAVIDRGAGGAQLKIKRLRVSDGAIVWQSLTPVPAIERGIPAELIDLVRSGDGAVVVSLGRQAVGTGGFESQIGVTRIDAGTGLVSWSRNISSDLLYNYNVAPLQTDLAGNVYVGAHLRPLHGVPGAGLRSVLKLDRATGFQAWRAEFPACTFCSPAWSPPQVHAIGNDVLVRELATAFPTFTWARLSGVDGTASWTSPTLSGQAFAVEPARALRADSSGGQIHIEQIDLGDGSVDWSSTYRDPDDTYYGVTRALRGDDGAIYVGGVRNVGSARQGLALRLDAADGAIDWVQRLQPNPATGATGAVNLIAQSDGELHFTHVFNDAATVTTHRFLTTLDSADGTIVATRFLDRTDTDQPQRVADMSARSDALDGALLTAAQRWSATAAPAFVVNARPLSLADAVGALSVALEVTPAAANAPTAIVFVTRNDGAIAASGSEALIDIPAGVLASNVACTHGAVTCDAIVTPTSIAAIVDLAAGAELRLAATLRTIPGASGARILFASTYAGHGFAEVDMNDNRVSTLLFDALFADGFD